MGVSKRTVGLLAMDGMLGHSELPESLRQQQAAMWSLAIQQPSH